MKITIIDAYTWYNKGDAGILLGTVESLNQMYNNPEIRVLSFTPRLDQLKYSQVYSNINLVRTNLLNPYPLKKTKFQKLIAIGKLAKEKLIQDIIFKISKEKYLKKYESARIINDSDVVYVCGGGFLGGKKFNSLIHLHQIKKATKLNDNCILWGTSVEPPTNKLLKKITEATLGDLNLILPREDITENYLNTFYPKSKTIATPDMAFNLKTIETQRIEDLMDKLGSGKKIGITIRDWHFPNSIDSEKDKQNYFKSIVEIIERKSALGYKFVFIPQVIFTGDDDRIIAKEVKEHLNNKYKNNFVVLEDDYSPGELKYLISKLDLFLGTRMHSNIFATSVGVPTFAIAYERKTNGIMNRLNMNEYVVDIEDVSAEKVLVGLQSLEENKDIISESLKKSVQHFQNNINSVGKTILNEVDVNDYDNIVKRAN
ncbi:polysaccharide pyruvyl transferase family protein [Halobacillus sp. ACCC02827]|uniref:polysaccharide pyruvyl transferase family protein n=1 Tax=Halobacillus sp. ACCC02827 TaxID=3052090 RepID=UPI0025701A54|nr:polysaccharide pyruvyl transferase family protein [Halobacillus sp. ACCC02827]WJE15270.1 polysaccharide pyruvyl transferase family protein [Halobacillus sp. ACCC02827]